MHPDFSQLTPQWFYRAHVYTGSIGEFRYRFAQDPDNHAIIAAVYSHYCYEVARDVIEQSFPWDEEGIARLREWLEEQWEIFHQEKKLS